MSLRFFVVVNEAADFIFFLLTFAAGYFICPLAALLLGSIGDRTGCKKGFLNTITMMSLFTFVMVATECNIHFGLWYPFTVALVGVLVLGFLLPETYHRDISRN